MPRDFSTKPNPRASAPNGLGGAGNSLGPKSPMAQGPLGTKVVRGRLDAHRGRSIPGNSTKTRDGKAGTLDAVVARVPPAWAGPAVANQSWSNGAAITPVAFASGFTAGAGGTITYSLVGTLPTGVTLASGTGIVSGTPTVNGTFNFAVKRTEAATGKSATSNLVTAVVSA